MHELDGRTLHSRVKGRASIERTLRALVIRCHRLGNGRQLTAEDAAWVRRLIDRLGEALQLDNREARR